MLRHGGHSGTASGPAGGTIASLRNRPLPLAGARGLDAVQERVHRGSTALDPGREAVTARAPILGGHIDCLRRATFDDLSLDGVAPQRPVSERGGDCGSGLGDRRRLGGILELGHGTPSAGNGAGERLLLSVLLDQLYRRSPNARPTASPAVRTPEPGLQARAA